MRVLPIFLVSVSWAQVAASDVQAIFSAAHSAFERMPDLEIVERIEGKCGADAHVNQGVAYCTSENKIYLNKAVQDTTEASYLVAHVLGHAAQVNHGVADQALTAIRARPDDEIFLRGLVTRQVECLAGLFYAISGAAQGRLSDWFVEEPFNGSHWGRNPLRIGPKVSIGLEARDVWFQKGQAAVSPADCAVGELDAKLLVNAYKL